MTSPLVATKLLAPRRRTSLVTRARLLDRLEGNAISRLTLISAPAGFGKTTLLAEWLAKANGSAVAWLSLEKADNDVARFWAYFIAALQRAAPALGETVLLGLQQGGSPAQLALAGLVNELGELAGGLSIVLDDYHVIEAPEIHAGMAFLLENLPTEVRLVIGTRVDPPLPLAQLRVRGDLVEVRSADLRFSNDEASSYFNDAMHLSLAARDIAALSERTEGWIAALQLAALSMRGREDVAGFVAGFTGNDRYVFDYLVEEVLQRQTAEVRQFLVETCFLDRLSGPLCDAVIGATGSAAMLEVLERGNLFVVPLDDRRQWYRYHHLFADVLASHAGAEGGANQSLRHRRASDWYAAQGESDAAIRHALEGDHFERAAELIERAIPDMQRNRGEATIRGWAHALPAAVVRNRPVLGIGLVGGLISYGEFESIESRLGDIERALQTLGPGNGPGPEARDTVVVDTAQLPRLPGAVALYRAALAQRRGDVPDIIAQAQRVIDLAPLDDDVGRAAGSSMLGIAHWSQGDLEAGRKAWTDGRDGLQRAGHVPDVLGVSIAIADILLAQGKLRGAVETCEHALRLAAATSDMTMRGTADMHASLAELCRQSDDRAGAVRHLSMSQRLAEHCGLPQHPYRWRVVAARLRQDIGDLAGAAALLDEAERVYVSDFFPDVRPMAAMRTRLLIAQRRLDEAARWQRDRGLGVEDGLSYLREFEHITLAELLLAQKDRSATDFAGRLLAAAIDGGRMGTAIEISVLAARAQIADNDKAAAAAILERAVLLAEPEGLVRVFVDGGEPIAALLKLLHKRGVVPAYVRWLIAAFAPAEAELPAHPEMIEALSQRERDVLRLLRSELGGPEIARELMVSLNTLRTHTKNLYDKLGVNNRRAAVRRGEDLNLLTRKPH